IATAAFGAGCGAPLSLGDAGAPDGDGGGAPVSVLIVGQVNGAAAEATVWRDRVRTTLSEPGLSITAHAALIDAAGRSVVGGWYSVGGVGATYPAYWIDGGRQVINSTDTGVVRAIAEDPTTGLLVAAGEIDGPAGSYAAYWREGIHTLVAGGPSGTSSVL